MSFHVSQLLQQMQGQIDLSTARVGLFRATVAEVDAPGRLVRLTRNGSTEAEQEWRPVITGAMPVVGARVNCLPYHAPGGQTPTISVIGPADSSALADGSVTTAKLADSSVTGIKIATGVMKQVQVVSPDSFHVVTTTRSVEGNAPILIMADSVSSYAYGILDVPFDTPTLASFRIYMRSPSGAGNVVIFCDASKISPDVAFPAATDSGGYGVAQTGNAQYQGLFTNAFDGLALAGGDLVGFRIWRSGAHSSDTTTGNLYIYGVVATFT